jgi:hypothetical protein
MVTTPVWSAGITDVRIQGNQYIASLDLTGVEGLITITFEELGVALVPTSLDIEASLVDPTSSAITSRLPNGYFIPARFPVLIHITPGTDPVTSIVFNGSYLIEIETPNLTFESRAPYRLLKAPDGDAFTDSTLGIGLGSYRVRGASGSFSEFLLAADLRRPEQVIDEKFLAIQDLLDTYTDDITTVVRANLQAHLTAARLAFNNGNINAAISSVRSMEDEVKEQAGVGITHTFNDTEVSVAGLLHGAIRSLHLSLILYKQTPLPETAMLSEHFDLGSGLSLTVNLRFEGSQALELDAFSISADLIDVNDPALLTRIPAGVTIPSEFPVLVEVGHGIAAAQAFRGAFSLEIETDDLDFYADTPLRLFKAVSSTASFADISSTLGLGSYRVRGASGSFSQFMILADLRELDAVITDKYNRLNALLDTYAGAIDTTVASDLQGLLDQATLDYQAGLYREAVDGIDAFLDLVEAEAGNGIPDIWHISDGRVNIAARLHGEARTLRFSLVLKRSPPAADPADANRDGNVDILDVFYVISRVFPDSQANSAIDEE